MCSRTCSLVAKAVRVVWAAVAAVAGAAAMVKAAVVKALAAAVAAVAGRAVAAAAVVVKAAAVVTAVVAAMVGRAAMEGAGIRSEGRSRRSRCPRDSCSQAPNRPAKSACRLDSSHSSRARRCCRRA